MPIILDVLSLKLTSEYRDLTLEWSISGIRGLDYVFCPSILHLVPSVFYLPSPHFSPSLEFTVAAAILLQAVSPWWLGFTPLVRCRSLSRFLLSPINSATTCRTSPSTCSWGEITETGTRRRPTVRAPALVTLRPRGWAQCRPKILCPSLAGMTVEMVAMLLASVIQGQVVAVYNTEKQEACQHADQETPQSTSSAQNASLQGTVDALHLKC